MSVVRRHNKQCSQKYISNKFHAYMFCATKDSTGHTVKSGRSRDAHKWPTRNVSEHLWTSFKLSEFIQGRNCGHICSGKWLWFCMIRFLRKWTIQNPNNGFRWYCCFRSGIRELLQWRSGSDIHAMKTGKLTWHSVRTSQRTPRVWSKNHILLPQYVWVAFYCGIVNN
jgi:hypothetical protein